MPLFDFLRRLFGAQPPARETPPARPPQPGQPTAPPSRGHPAATGTRPATAGQQPPRPPQRSAAGAPPGAERRAPGNAPQHATRTAPQSRPAAPAEAKAAPSAQVRQPSTTAPLQARTQPPVAVPLAQLKRAAAATQRPIAQTKPTPPAPPQPAPPAAPAPAASQQPVGEPLAKAPATLKPNHRRLAVDGSGAQAGGAGRPQRARLSGPDARRWFSATMRTRARPLRGLGADEAQLARYGLPVWSTEVDVAQALEVDVRTLRHFSMHSARDRSSHYVSFMIPKRSGGERLIMAPKSRLKAIQRRLHRLLVSKLPVSEYAHGFRTQRSVRSNAQPHVGKGVVLRLDIEDFFPSLHFGRVRGLLIALGYGYQVATVLAVLMTEAPRQPVSAGQAQYFAPVGPRACPQGAPTSPGLSNALLVKMDHRLAGLARQHGFGYTRYADDLTFSGDDLEKVHALRHLAARVVREEGFTVNRDKTRVMRRGSRQTVTGVTVNEVLGLSRQERRRLRAALHQAGQWESGGMPSPLRGMLAYVSMLNRGQAARLQRKT